MIVLGCGGRDYDDGYRVMEILDEAHRRYGITEIVTGAAKGADYLVEEWAKTNRLMYRGMPAQWHIHNKAAGPIRNNRMLELYNPDMVVAFPGGNGTAHMINAAKKNNKKVVVID